jgi:hypothetical protein
VAVLFFFFFVGGGGGGGGLVGVWLSGIIVWFIVSSISGLCKFVLCGRVDCAVKSGQIYCAGCTQRQLT